jgi:hypothetical protein
MDSHMLSFFFKKKKKSTVHTYENETTNILSRKERSVAKTAKLLLIACSNDYGCVHLRRRIIRALSSLRILWPSLDPEKIAKEQ